MRPRPEEEIPELKIFWLIFLRHWWLITLGVGVGLFVAWATFSSGPLTYVAGTKILVQGGGVFGNSISIEGSEQVALSYRDLVTTRIVMEQVAERLSLPDSPDGLKEAITTRVTRGVLEIRARSFTAEGAAALSNATAQVFVDQVRDWQLNAIATNNATAAQFGLSQGSIPAASALAAAGITLSIIEPAISPGGPSSVSSNTQRMAFGGFIGLVIAAGLAMLRDNIEAW